MTPRRILVGAVGIAAIVSACGGAPPAPAPPAAPTPAAAAPPAAPAAAPAAALVTKDTAATAKAAAEVLAPSMRRYEVKGRRDPFENLEVAVKARETAPAASVVTSSKLTGIVRGASMRLALVETAQGMGYILKSGDTLGEGRVVEIGMDEVVFSVPPKPGSTTNRVVLKIVKD
jgi:hypothetical protein